MMFNIRPVEPIFPKMKKKCEIGVMECNYNSNSFMWIKWRRCNSDGFGNAEATWKI